MQTKTGPTPQKRLLSELIHLFAGSSETFFDAIKNSGFPFGNLKTGIAAHLFSSFIDECGRQKKETLLPAFRALSEAAPVSKLLEAIVKGIEAADDVNDFFEEIVARIPAPVDLAPDAPVVTPAGVTPNNRLQEWQRERIRVVAVASRKVGSNTPFVPCVPNGRCRLQAIVLSTLGEVTRTGEAMAETREIAGHVYEILSELSKWTDWLEGNEAFPNRAGLNCTWEKFKGLHNCAERTKAKRVYKEPLKVNGFGCDACAWLEKCLQRRTGLDRPTREFVLGFSLVYHGFRNEIDAGKTVVDAFQILDRRDEFLTAITDCLRFGEPLRATLIEAVIPMRERAFLFLNQGLRFSNANALAGELAVALDSHRSGLGKQGRVFKT